MRPLPTQIKEDLAAFYEDPNHLEKLVQQVIKDLEWRDDVTADSLADLYSLIHGFFDAKSGDSQVLSVLYRIDVPEDRVNAALESGEFETIAELVAVHVLLREAQKVFFRVNYSQNS